MRVVRSGRLIKLALGGILSMMGEWMTQQMMGGMAGRLGQTPLAAHVTMQVRTSATDSLVAALVVVPAPAAVVLDALSE